MATNKRQVLIRVQPDTYAKLKVISDKNHRSVFNQLEWLMLQFIVDYEAQNGKIAVASDIVPNSVVQKNRSGNNYIAMGKGNNFNAVSQ